MTCYGRVVTCTGKQNGVLYILVLAENGANRKSPKALKRDAPDEISLISPLHVNVTISVFVVIAGNCFLAISHLGAYAASTEEGDCILDINPLKAQWLVYVPPARTSRTLHSVHICVFRMVLTINRDYGLCSGDVTGVILLLLLLLLLLLFRSTWWFRQLRRRTKTRKYACSTPDIEVIQRSDVVAPNNEKWEITEVLPT
jgi:hypothetical protein